MTETYEDYRNAIPAFETSLIKKARTIVKEGGSHDAAVAYGNEMGDFIDARKLLLAGQPVPQDATHDDILYKMLRVHIGQISEATAEDEDDPALVRAEATLAALQERRDAR